MKLLDILRKLDRFGKAASFTSGAVTCFPHR